MNRTRDSAARATRPSKPRRFPAAGVAFAVVLAVLAGCAVGPNYRRPPVATPDNYRFATAAAATNSFGDLPWWEVFQDPALQELIRAALTNNYDLQRAVARVEQARQQVTVARAPLFPQVGYGGDLGRGRNALMNSPASLGGATETSAQLNLNAVWEIDFWGRIRRLTEAARAQYLATEEARRGVTLTLVGDVAAAYFRLLDLDAQLAIQCQATNAYAGIYQIFNERRINGVASKLETERATAALANASAALPELKLQISATENQINVLLGRQPGPVARGALADLPPFPPDIPAGLPSALLQRRPDIVASEQLLIAANADIGASFANFFPQIGLTTFLGKVSPELATVTGGSANAWNVGATLAGPLFQGGALRAQYRQAKAKFDAAKAAYEQSVVVALREVSDALAAREQYAQKMIYEGQAATALAESVKVATERYLNGKASYFEVLQAQQELYPTQRAEVQSRAAELLATVQLYRALGGGWSGTEAPAPTRP